MYFCDTRTDKKTYWLIINVPAYFSFQENRHSSQFLCDTLLPGVLLFAVPRLLWLKVSFFAFLLYILDAEV